MDLLRFRGNLLFCPNGWGKPTGGTDSGERKNKQGRPGAKGSKRARWEGRGGAGRRRAGAGGELNRHWDGGTRSPRAADPAPSAEMNKAPEAGTAGGEGAGRKGNKGKRKENNVQKTRFKENGMGLIGAGGPNPAGRKRPGTAPLTWASRGRGTAKDSPGPETRRLPAFPRARAGKETDRGPPAVPSAAFFSAA